MTLEEKEQLINMLLSNNIADVELALEIVRNGKITFTEIEEDELYWNMNWRIANPGGECLILCLKHDLHRSLTLYRPLKYA